MITFLENPMEEGYTRFCGNTLNPNISENTKDMFGNFNLSFVETVTTHYEWLKGKVI